MASDERLVERVRAVIGQHPALAEKRMFGGVGFLIAGNMAVGVNGDELMVRVGKAGHAAALERAGARTMDFTGRPMEGWIMVAPAGLGQESLEWWVRVGVAFAEGLPAR